MGTFPDNFSPSLVGVGYTGRPFLRGCPVVARHLLLDCLVQLDKCSLDVGKNPDIRGLVLPYLPGVSVQVNNLGGRIHNLLSGIKELRQEVRPDGHHDVGVFHYVRRVGYVGPHPAFE